MSFGYFNKHNEEIYECGKMLTFEDMNPGITFIFYENKTLEKINKVIYNY